MTRLPLLYERGHLVLELFGQVIAYRIACWHWRRLHDGVCWLCCTENSQLPGPSATAAAPILEGVRIKTNRGPKQIFPASRPARPLQGRLARAWASQRRTSYLTKWKQRQAKIKPPNTRSECRVPMRAIAPATRIPTPNTPNMTFLQVFDKCAVWRRMLPARRFGGLSACAVSVSSGDGARRQDA